MPRTTPCPRCDGLGRTTPRAVPCTACGGSGEPPAAPVERRAASIHRCYECDRPEDEFAECRVCNPELRD